jgi:23S rRNA (cytosine1962-C5)-methyltransferase
MNPCGNVVLKRNEEHRVLHGHLWIFSNEILSIEGNPENGNIVTIEDSRRKHFLGYGFYNKNSLIAVRIISKEKESELQDVLRDNILRANNKRLSLGYTNVYRMVFGESDFLPGLIIDRYDRTFVLESYCLAMDKQIEFIAEIITKEFAPLCIVEKSLSQWRHYEGLEPSSRVLMGSLDSIESAISAISYKISILEAQKTGLFLDQAENRLKVQQLSANKRVLDCFCNDGGFGLHAAKGGAASVVGVDASLPAIERAIENAQINGLSSISFRNEDVFDFLNSCKETDQTFDVIILDPPAFVKSKNKIATGLAGYEKLNRAALRLISGNGILVTCSCSHHISETVFLEMLQRAAFKEKKVLQVFAATGAGMDHPVLPCMPETKYLKCVFVNVLDAAAF